jgi:hypothetical protein
MVNTSNQLTGLPLKSNIDLFMARAKPDYYYLRLPTNESRLPDAPRVVDISSKFSFVFVRGTRIYAFDKVENFEECLLNYRTAEVLTANEIKQEIKKLTPYYNPSAEYALFVNGVQVSLPMTNTVYILDLAETLGGMMKGSGWKALKPGFMIKEVAKESES